MTDDNVRPSLIRYLRLAILPAMQQSSFFMHLPPPGHKSHRNYLQARSDQFRRLRDIHPSVLGKTPLSWNESCVSETLMITSDNQRDLHSKLKIKADGWYPPNIASEEEAWRANLCRGPEGMEMSSLAAYMALVLPTAERAIHMCIPASSDFRFMQGPKAGTDSELMRHYTWTLANDTYTNATMPETMRAIRFMVFFQPPWILSDADIEEFAKQRSFPEFMPAGATEPTVLQGKHRIWATISDRCQTSGASWFVLTSYSKWVFGKFTNYRKAAHISQVYDYNSTAPTILQLLVFWAASAMNVPMIEHFKAFPDEVNDDPKGPTRNPKLPRRGRVAPSDGIPSESNWDGKSDDIASTIGYPSTARVSDAGLDVIPTPMMMQNTSNARRRSTREWLREVEREQRMAAGLAPLPSSQSSSATIDPSSRSPPPASPPVVVLSGDEEEYAEYEAPGHWRYQLDANTLQATFA